VLLRNKNVLEMREGYKFQSYRYDIRREYNLQVERGVFSDKMVGCVRVNFLKFFLTEKSHRLTFLSVSPGTHIFPYGFL